MFRKKAQKLTDLQEDTSSALQKTQELQKQLEHQKVLVKSLWTILKDKLSLTDDDLHSVLKDVKASQENKIKVAELCENCSRPIQANTKICIYCGAAHDRHTVF